MSHRQEHGFVMVCLSQQMNRRERREELEFPCEFACLPAGWIDSPGQVCTADRQAHQGSNGGHCYWLLVLSQPTHTYKHWAHCIVTISWLLGRDGVWIVWKLVIILRRWQDDAGRIGPNVMQLQLTKITPHKQRGAFVIRAKRAKPFRVPNVRHALLHSNNQQRNHFKFTTRLVLLNHV